MCLCQISSCLSLSQHGHTWDVSVKKGEVMKKYAWKHGSVVAVDAEEAAQQFGTIVEEYGALLPDVVVEQSRPEDAPLHDAFEWNDKAAADKYRYDQARYLIRSLTIVHEEDEEEHPPIRAYMSINHAADDEKAEVDYLPTLLVMSKPILRKRLLSTALKELESWERRYQNLVEFSQVYTAIAAAKESLQ